MFVKISQKWRQISAQDTDTLLRKALLYSLGIHVLFIIAGPLVTNFQPRLELMDAGIEVAMETLPEMDSGHETLPNAQKADEAQVPDNILPQLPKTVTVDTQKKQDNPEADKVAEEKPEEKKDESNKIDKMELQKRLAIERLRKLQDKKSKSYKAPNVEELASLKKTLEKFNRVGSVPMGTNANSQFAQCKVDFDRLVRQSYELPRAYNLKELTVSFDISFTSNGQISQAEISQSSGDKLFDQLTLDGLRAATPLPESCRSLAGQAIRLSFKL